MLWGCCHRCQEQVKASLPPGSSVSCQGLAGWGLLPDPCWLASCCVMCFPKVSRSSIFFPRAARLLGVETTPYTSLDHPVSRASGCHQLPCTSGPRLLLSTGLIQNKE